MSLLSTLNEFTSTGCFQLVRKDLIHWSRSLFIPTEARFCRSLLCVTLSNALSNEHPALSVCYQFKVKPA